MKSEQSLLEAGYARTLLPLARMWRQAADRALSSTGVSASKGWVLAQVSRLGDDVRQTDLANELDLTAASLIRLLNLITASGMVERHRDPTDARVSRIRLTSKGQEAVAEIEDSLATLRGDMLSGIIEDDLTVALRVTEPLATRFQRWHDA